VRCDDARLGLSARLDGEDPGVPDAVLDAHVEICSACEAWLDRAAAVSRRLRLKVSEPTTDLAPAVVERVGDPAVMSRPSRPLARVGLGLTALLQLALSLPALLMGQEDAGVHVARELGVMDVALAIGVLAAAWRPWRAAGMLPVVAALAVGLSATTVVDIVGGEIPAVAEIPHLLALVEVALLWRLRVAGVPPRRSRPPEQGGRLRRVA
jgi:predicted anti-sigma-YlaC factor YlaD